MKKVGVIMGSDSDLPIIQKATDTLKSLDIPFEVHIFSAHRTPVEARNFSVNHDPGGSKHLQDHFPGFGLKAIDAA